MCVCVRITHSLEYLYLVYMPSASGWFYHLSMWGVFVCECVCVFVCGFVCVCVILLSCGHGHNRTLCVKDLFKISIV